MNININISREFGSSGGVAATTPLTIFGSASVIQWVNAGLGVTLNVGKVATLADQSSSALDYTAAGSAQPAFTTTDASYNNKSTFTTDGVANTLTSSLNLPLASVTPTCLLFIFKPIVCAATFVPIGPNGATVSKLINIDSATTINSLNGSFVTRAVAAGTWYRVRADYSNNAADIFKVGSSQTTGNVGDTAVTNGRLIGSRTIQFINAAFREVIYLNRIPTGSEMTAYDNYITAESGGAVQV